MVPESEPAYGVAVRRAGFVLVSLLLLLGGLAGQLFRVQVAQHGSYAERRDEQMYGFMDVCRARGIIRDARGETLALSVPVSSVFVVPGNVRDREELSAAIGLALPELDSEREFLWVKRRVSEEEAARAREVAACAKRERRLVPVGVREEFARRYPSGRLAAHVIGRVDREERGLEGMEWMFEDLLGGATERQAVSVDGKRHKLSFPDAPQGGYELDLTIDLVVQRIVEEELDLACAEFRPKWAMAVVVDPRTGAILALANRPSFDPNLPVTDLKAHQNLVLTAPFEPGSTFKPFLVAAALEEGLITPTTLIDCEMGTWKHGSRVLHDHHPYGSLCVRDIVAKSSNIGAAKIGALVLGRLRMRKWIESFGFGRLAGIELPGENAGRLTAANRWNSMTDTSVPMGHEIGVTALQLVMAMSAIANGGMLRNPFVIHAVRDGSGDEVWQAPPQPGRRVLSERTCTQMREILTEVVRAGTGQRAAVEGVLVAGKTGTTQKVDPATGRYTHGRHISSFVGFAPAEAPRLCLAVILDEPQGEYYGGAVAAPVVGAIIRRGLPHTK